MSFELISEITSVEDYKDPKRDIVSVVFYMDKNGLEERVSPAPPNTSPNVGPQAGCVLVLGGNSISESSLFEVSGVTIMTQLNGWSGFVKGFTYCDKANLTVARADFLDKARKRLQDRIESFERSLAECQKTLKKLDQQ
jgi:hypothetical protein